MQYWLDTVVHGVSISTSHVFSPNPTLIIRGAKMKLLYNQKEEKDKKMKGK
jgi:hypothetical protein